MISRKRAKYAALTSSGSDEDLPAPTAPSPETISCSICFVTSGSAGAPSGVENLMPLHSGGLCDAVKLMAPSAFS